MTKSTTRRSPSCTALSLHVGVGESVERGPQPRQLELGHLARLRFRLDAPPSGDTGGEPLCVIKERTQVEMDPAVCSRAPSDRHVQLPRNSMKNMLQKHAGGIAVVRMDG